MLVLLLMLMMMMMRIPHAINTIVVPTIKTTTRTQTPQRSSIRVNNNSCSLKRTITRVSITSSSSFIISGGGGARIF